jgi:hypothetical protein
VSKDLEPTTIGKLALGKSMADSEQWYVIPCPANVQLTSVLKERGTHGAIYALWECEKRTPCWIGQSIPALVRSINEKAVIAPEKRLHASSLYRCLRREARKESHKSWKVEKFARADITELNHFLGEFPSIVVTSKSPELWHCSPLSSVEEEEVEDVEAHVPVKDPATPPSHSDEGTSSDTSA